MDSSRSNPLKNEIGGCLRRVSARKLMGLFSGCFQRGPVVEEGIDSLKKSSGHGIFAQEQLCRAGSLKEPRIIHLVAARSAPRERNQHHRF